MFVITRNRNIFIWWLGSSLCCFPLPQWCFCASLLTLWANILIKVLTTGMVQRKGSMASRREEQRRREQSLALSFSVSGSRRDLRVRMVGSLCSFLKCRTLVCIIYENERLSLLVFIKLWVQCSVFVKPQALSLVKLGTSLIQFLKQKFLKSQEIALVLCDLWICALTCNAWYHVWQNLLICSRWGAVWESLCAALGWLSAPLSPGLLPVPLEPGKELGCSCSLRKHSTSWANTVCDENTCASWQSHSLLPLPALWRGLSSVWMDTEVLWAGVSCVHRAGRCWGMSLSSWVSLESSGTAAQLFLLFLLLFSWAHSVSRGC